MWVPTCPGDPGKVSDVEYACATDDGGGVHSNSGVPNHGYALLVDGGTYNGVDGHRHRPRQGRGDLLPGDDAVPDADDRLRRPRGRARGLVRRPGRGADRRAERRADAPGPTRPTRSTEADCDEVDERDRRGRAAQGPDAVQLPAAAQAGRPGRSAARAPATTTVWSENFEDGLAGWERDAEIVFPGGGSTPWAGRLDSARRSDRRRGARRRRPECGSVHRGRRRRCRRVTRSPAR